MTRAADGLPGESMDHEDVKRIVEWAEGDAHDALAALLTAADMAATNGDERLDTGTIEASLGSVPRPSVSLGAIFALPPNRQKTLRVLVDLDTEDWHP